MMNGKNRFPSLMWNPAKQTTDINCSSFPKTFPRNGLLLSIRGIEKGYL